MNDLHLSEQDQAAVRAVVAVQPMLGRALSVDDGLGHVTGLITCDAAGIAILDDDGATPGPGDFPNHDASTTRPHVGVHRLDRAAPAGHRTQPRGVAVLSLGVGVGVGHVATLWLLRRTWNFTARDVALLQLVSPALERMLRQNAAVGLSTSLTSQERRVLALVAAGLSNTEIADRLFVAPCTVRKHLENAYRKLGVTNRTAAVMVLEGGRAVDDDLACEPVLTVV